MNFSKELLFTTGFILVVVLFIQYIIYSRLNKNIKEVSKRVYLLCGDKMKKGSIQNLPESSQQDKSQQDKSQQDKSQQIKSQQIKLQQIKLQQDKSQQIKLQQDKSHTSDNESYEVDTPEDLNDADDDSYVNPVHSEKNIDDDD